MGSRREAHEPGIDWNTFAWFVQAVQPPRQPPQQPPYIYPAAWPVKQSKHGIIRTYRVIQQKHTHETSAIFRHNTLRTNPYFVLSLHYPSRSAAQPLSRFHWSPAEICRTHQQATRFIPVSLRKRRLVPGCCSCRSCCVICKAIYMVSDQSVSLIIGRGEARREDWERIGSTPIFLCQRVVRPSTERA